jgi:ribosomal protein L7/L12
LSQHLNKFKKAAKDAAEDAKKQIEAAGGKASLVFNFTLLTIFP